MQRTLPRVDWLFSQTRVTSPARPRNVNEITPQARA
jgi:hypothetical protein